MNQDEIETEIWQCETQLLDFEKEYQNAKDGEEAFFILNEMMWIEAKLSQLKMMLKEL